MHIYIRSSRYTSYMHLRRKLGACARARARARARTHTHTHIYVCVYIYIYIYVYIYIYTTHFFLFVLLFVRQLDRVTRLPIPTPIWVCRIQRGRRQDAEHRDQKEGVNNKMHHNTDTYYCVIVHCIIGYNTCIIHEHPSFCFIFCSTVTVTTLLLLPGRLLARGIILFLHDIADQ